MHTLSYIVYLVVAAVVPILATDCNFSGGFALRQPGSCSSDNNAPVSCDGGYAYRCCPKGTFCKKGHDGAYCCPTDDDCYQDLNNAPKCPRNDWSLWVVSNYQFSDAWCCNVGSFGVWRSPTQGFGGAVECASFGASLTSNQVPAILTTPSSYCTTATFGRSTSESRSDATNTFMPSQTSSLSGSADSSSSSLSKGAIAGIVVGSIAGAALLVFGTWWIIHYRAANIRGNTPTDKASHTTNTLAYQQPTEAPTHTASWTGPISEIGESNAIRTHELAT